MNSNRGKGVNEGNRQPNAGSRGGDRRGGVETPKVSGVVARNSVATTDGAKQGRSKVHNESHYHRVLEELSSPACLRVRVNVKKPLVMSRTLRYPVQTSCLRYCCLAPRCTSRNNMRDRDSDKNLSNARLHSALVLVYASGAGGVSRHNNTSATGRSLQETRLRPTETADCAAGP